MRISEMIRVAPKSVWVPGKGKISEISMDKLTGNYKDRRKTVNLPWLKKFVKEFPKGTLNKSNKKPYLWIQIDVWDEDNAVNPLKKQMYSIDQLSSAKSYAKNLVENGQAPRTRIVAVFDQRLGEYDRISERVHDFGSFEVKK